MMTTPKTEAVLYIGSPAPKEEQGIVAYHMTKDGDSSITSRQSIALTGALNPSRIASSHSGKLLFAVTESPNMDDSRIHAWKLVEENGQNLESPIYLDNWPIGGTGACQIVVHRNDRFIYVANYGSGSLSAFKDAAKRGGLVRCNTYKFEGGSGVVPGKQESSHIASVIVLPDDNYVYAVDAGNDCVWKTNYSILCGFEFITELPQPFPAPEGSGPGRGVIAKRDDGLFLYIGCRFWSRLLVYWINEGESGALEQTQYVPVIPQDEAGDEQSTVEEGVTDLQISSDQRFLYAASSFRNAISIFSIDQAGDANFVQWVESGGSMPRCLALLPDFDMVLVGHGKSKDLTAFVTDTKNGNISNRADINGNNKLELTYEPSSLVLQ